MKLPTMIQFCAACTLLLTCSMQQIKAQSIEPLTSKGNAFVNAQGQSVRFWGTNLVALYPSKQQAQQIANDLAYHQINLARPHHMMRPSRDWVWQSKVATLNNYTDGNTRKPDKDAWDRFDYLNAKLRKKGIYLMFAGRWSRNYLPYDVDVLETTDEDAAAWIMAMEAFNKRHWKKNLDSRKLLPMVDERVAALDMEFIKQTLTHVNPYTKLAYAKDPQVVTYEVTNEYSSEYTLICTNTLTEYFQNKLIAKWEAFAKAAGLAEPGDLYKARSTEHKNVRAAFFLDLDEQYFIKMKKAIRDTGFKGAITFSNLWRGESALKMHADHADYIEDHAYVNPRVVDSREDFIYQKSKTILANKPYIIGEFNESEGGRIKTEGPYRSQLALAAAVYGVHQGIDGIVWFAWQHGDRDLTAQGTAKKSTREPHLGTMVADEMMRDHLRTTGLIFRHALVDPSSHPINFAVGKPHLGTDYNAMMRPNKTYRAGWQSIHAFGKSFDPPTAAILTHKAMRSEPASPIVSDTKQIIKDIDNKQLRIIAPKVEAFSGDMNSSSWDNGYQHLSVINHNGFATVILVPEDLKPLKESKSLLISRTMLDQKAKEVESLNITIGNLVNNQATFKITRPQRKTIELKANSQGVFELPQTGWFEAQILLK